MVESMENIGQPEVFLVNPIETFPPGLDTPPDHVAQHPQPPLDDVAQHPHRPSKVVPDEREPRKVLLSLADYIMLTKDEQKKSRWALYRAFRSGKLGLSAEVLCIGKKRYYFVKVDDPKIIEKAIINKREKEILQMLEKSLSYIYIQVPLNMSQEVDLISSPDNPSYKRFHEFINQSSGVVLLIKTNSNHTPGVKRRIKIRKEDYQKVLEIAKANDLSVGKVIVAFLKSYFKAE